MTSEIASAPPGFDQDLKPVETPLAVTATFAVGSFGCPVLHPVFAGSGPLHCNYIVFARSAVEIIHADGSRWVSTVGTANLYNRGDSYARRAIADEGDRCDYLVVAPSMLADLIAAASADADHALAAPWFALRQMRVSAKLFLRQRLFFEALVRSRSHFDPLAFEEEAAAIAYSAIAESHEQCGDNRPERARARRTDQRQRDAVERAREYLARNVGSACSLEQIGQAAFVSPFHLARLFPKYTGYTLHGFQTQLRLRMALELLPDFREDLSCLALRLGFSHHSHFTSQFARHFGVQPRAFQRLLIRNAPAARAALAKRH